MRCQCWDSTLVLFVMFYSEAVVGSGLLATNDGRRAGGGRAGS
jgi:hypothetical protein